MVGSHLVERLLERRDAVRALVRNLSRAEHLMDLGVEVVRGDLCEPASLRQAMGEIEVVYHCAARVALPYQGDRAEIFKTNVEGTSHLLEASVQAGVRRFVFVSSVAVYGNVDEEPISEDHPTSPNGHYAESKLLAERLVREYHGSQGLEAVILRPCVIYGPRDHNFLPQIFETLLQHRFPLVDGGRHLLDMVYVTDVAEALVLAGTKREANGQIYNVTDGETHYIRELVELFGRVLKRAPRTVNVPYPIAYGFAALSYAWSRLRRPSEDPIIRPAGVRTMARPHHYDISKIKEELGYQPKVKLEEGLRWAIEWYLEWKGDMGDLSR
jgi:nucleoside-diphosphate-sugar epimerase